MIKKIIVPFENIYTSVFLVERDGEAIIFDSGSSNSDSEAYVIPEIKKLRLYPQHLVSSHSHGDHSGGLEALVSAFPYAKVGAKGGDILLERFEIISLPGHSPDSVGLLDRESRILLSADCFQQYGVGRYGTSVCDFDAYFKSIDTARKLKLNVIMASHEYERLGWIAEGEKIDEWLDASVSAAEIIIKFAREQKGEDFEEMASRFNLLHEGLPPVNHVTMKAALG